MRTWAWILILPLFALYGLMPIEPVMQMALIAISIFLLLKGQTLLAYRSIDSCVQQVSCIAWFVAWPGLDAGQFFTSSPNLPSPRLGIWALAFANTFIGLTLFFVLAPRLVDWNEMTAGWVAIVGIGFILHFGFFHIVALAWRHAGRDVSPIMNSPILATSLAEFWNRRWNVAFRDFTYAQVFRPVAKRYGATIASWVGFVFSGFVHELAISVPAHAGYGLPMSYFLLQGMGVAIERKAHQHGWWTRKSVCGWLFVVLFTVPAAYYLFHPQFIHRVILPLIGT